MNEVVVEAEQHQSDEEVDADLNQDSLDLRVKGAVTPFLDANHHELTSIENRQRHQVDKEQTGVHRRNHEEEVAHAVLERGGADLDNRDNSVHAVFVGVLAFGLDDMAQFQQFLAGSDDVAAGLFDCHRQRLAHAGRDDDGATEGSTNARLFIDENGNGFVVPVAIDLHIHNLSAVCLDGLHELGSAFHPLLVDAQHFIADLEACDFRIHDAVRKLGDNRAFPDVFDLARPEISQAEERESDEQVHHHTGKHDDGHAPVRKPAHVRVDVAAHEPVRSELEARAAIGSQSQRPFRRQPDREDGNRCAVQLSGEEVAAFMGENRAHHSEHHKPSHRRKKVEHQSVDGRDGDGVVADQLDESKRAEA